MKFSRVFSILCLAIMCTIGHQTLAEDGPGNGGGAFYAKRNGKPILLDTLESMGVFDPQTDPRFTKPLQQVNIILKKIQAIIPELANQMRSVLKEKKLHFIDFEIICEDPGTIVAKGVSAGACQNDFHIWFNISYFKSDAVKTIIHEMVQSIRLNSFNKNKGIPPAMVRELTNLLTEKEFPSESVLQKRIVDCGFESYLGVSGLLAIESTLKNIYYKNCDLQQTKDNWNPAQTMYIYADLMSSEFNFKTSRVIADLGAKISYAYLNSEEHGSFYERQTLPLQDLAAWTQRRYCAILEKEIGQMESSKLKSKIE